MAKSKIDVTVSVERVIHDTLSSLLNTFAETYGVQVNEVRVDWIRFTGVPSVITEMRVETQICPKAKPQKGEQK
jgi:type II secretory pathway component PulM